MVKMGTRVNRMQFVNETTLLMRESYDLSGLQIRSISLPWPPYLMMTDCGGNHARPQECINDGYLIDFMEMARHLFNFTYVSLKDPNDDWGLGPKSGPHNLSGTWAGVMGGVINGEYDVSLSAWYWIFSRSELLSFAPVIRSR